MNTAYNPNCPACVAKRLHSEQDWKNHPFRGHGRDEHGKATHPDLEPIFRAETEERAKQVKK